MGDPEESVMNWQRFSNPMPRKSTLQKAVHEMQVYLGSVDYAPVRAQQKLQDRLRRTIDKVAGQTGMSTVDVWEQLEAEARSRGVVRPSPGKDY